MGDFTLALASGKRISRIPTATLALRYMEMMFQRLALIGGQLGYNYQVGRWLAGIEADASWLSSDGTNTCYAVSGLFLSSTCHVTPNFLGNLTARFGIAADPQGRTLFYGKGGLAVIHEDINITRNTGLPKDQGPTPIFPFGLEIGTTTKRTGWPVGAGVEQAVTPAWSWRFEYDYQHFGNFDALTPETSNLISFPPGQQPAFGRIDSPYNPVRQRIRGWWQNLIGEHARRRLAFFLRNEWVWPVFQHELASYYW